MRLHTFPPSRRNLWRSLRFSALGENGALRIQRPHPQDAIRCSFQSVLYHWAERTRVGNSGATGGAGQCTDLPLRLTLCLLRNKDLVRVQVCADTLNTEHRSENRPGPEHDTKLKLRILAQLHAGSLPHQAAWIVNLKGF